MKLIFAAIILVVAVPALAAADGFSPPAWEDLSNLDILKPAPRGIMGDPSLCQWSIPTPSGAPEHGRYEDRLDTYGHPVCNDDGFFKF